MFIYLNLYVKKSDGSLILKQVRNRHSYFSRNWDLLETYVIFDNKLFTYDEFRLFINSNRFNFFEKIVLFFRNL